MKAAQQVCRLTFRVFWRVLKVTLVLAMVIGLIVSWSAGGMRRMIGTFYPRLSRW